MNVVIGLSTVAVNVPSLLATTVTVTVLEDGFSLVIPSISPSSVTVYVYVPAAVYVNGPNVIDGLSLVTSPVIVATTGAPFCAVTVMSYAHSSTPVSPSGIETTFVTEKLAVIGFILLVIDNSLSEYEAT